MHHTQRSFDGKRHQGEVSCPLNRCRQLTLMASTVPRDTAWNNFTSLRHQVAQAPHVFVVDQGQFIGAESTDLFAQKAPAFARCRFLSRTSLPSSHSPTCQATLSQADL